MTTLLFSFLSGLAIALVLTPLAREFGTRFGALDVPDARKVHIQPVPRLGGLAIFAAVALTLAMLVQLDTAVTSRLDLHGQFGGLMGGALLCFATGLWDDFRSLPARIKLALQVLAATIAFASGNWIGMGFFEDYGLWGVAASYVITVGWFLLFINAVNLIDGLDGLAGGVCFFAAAVMTLISLLTGNHMMAMLFALLCGSVLGFLRYNFNPASIFLGDSGSYFLGFTFAGFALMGGVKEETGLAILIPLVAMGVPLFDTLLATVRRFLRGRAIFAPDNRHLHHRLVALGYTPRRAVLLVYGMTVLLGIAALVIVHFKDEGGAFVLVALAAGVIVLTRKLGFFEMLGTAELRQWWHDVTHATGLAHKRRSLLSVQLDIRKAGSLEEIRTHLTDAARLLEMDHLRLFLVDRATQQETCPPLSDAKWPEPCTLALSWDADGVTHRDEQACPGKTEDGAWFYRVELPIIAPGDGSILGVLILSKDHNLGHIGQASLLLIEHVRRVLGFALEQHLEPLRPALPSRSDAEETGVTGAQCEDKA